MQNTYVVIDGEIYDIVKREPTQEFHENLGGARKSSMKELGDEPAPCPDHPGKTLYHKEGKYGPFWSHKNDDGTYHNIKG